MAVETLEGRSLQIDEHRLHVRVAGESGPLVLLCHGFPESWHSWRHQIQPLVSEGYRVAIPDMRGYGRSSKPTDVGAYRITELVNDCVAVVRALGEQQAVIVGHDWGAPVAWTAAWTRPDVFRAVAGLSVPFGGRGLMALPGDPFGDVRPSVAHRKLAGSERLFYQEFFSIPGVSENDVEQDLRDWLLGFTYSASAASPVPAGFDADDLFRLSPERIVDFLRSKLCLPRGKGFFDLLRRPTSLPTWLTADEFDSWVGELEQGGMAGPLSYYRAMELNWELLGIHQGKPLTVPSLFIGGDRDTATIWGQEAVARAGEVLSDFRGAIIVPDCGHWIQQESPDIVNQELLTFLNAL
ncbi:alpha/beta hydrolase [Streptomyces sp. NPDC005799]|uniref:alpha/beta fold hydrolase n=1 Tax=Streptomyces sp. NPDC005799 TaxID=3154678 RepID=UPI0033F11B85